LGFLPFSPIPIGLPACDKPNPVIPADTNLHWA
jgi:hypothetical protein